MNGAFPEKTGQEDEMDTSTLPSSRTAKEVELTVGNKHTFLEAQHNKIILQGISCGKGEKNVDHGVTSNRGDHPVLMSAEIPQNKERGKDELHPSN